MPRLYISFLSRRAFFNPEASKFCTNLFNASTLRMSSPGSSIGVSAMKAVCAARGSLSRVPMVSTVAAYDDGHDLIDETYRVDPFIVELKGIVVPVQLVRIVAR